MDEVPDRGFDELVAEVRDRKPGEKQVIFAGREPPIHPNFLELVGEAREAGYFSIEVVTNGRIFASREFARSAVMAGLTDVMVGFFSSDPSVHDSLTRTPGSWKQTVAGIRNLLELREEMPPYFKPAVAVGIYLGRENHGQLGETLDLLESLGVREIFIINAGFSGTESVLKHAAGREAKVFTVGYDTPMSYEEYSREQSVLPLTGESGL